MATMQRRPASQDARRRSGFLAAIGRALRNRLLAGLAVFIPLAATFGVLAVGYRFFAEHLAEPVLRPFARWINAALDLQLPEADFPFFVNVLAALAFVLALIALGALAANVIGRRVLSWLDAALLRLPVVAFIYRAFKQVIESFRHMGSTRRFQRVVFVEYPAEGCRLIGFVTGRFVDQTRGRPVTSIFVPTSPNPMTGFVIVADDDRVQDSPLSLEDGMKMIFSAGIVGPTSLPPQAADDAGAAPRTG